MYSIETNADAGRVYIAGVGGMMGVLVDKFGGVYDQVGGDVSISDNIVLVGATLVMLGTFPMKIFGREIIIKMFWSILMNILTVD